MSVLEFLKVFCLAGYALVTILITAIVLHTPGFTLSHAPNDIHAHHY